MKPAMALLRQLSKPKQQHFTHMQWQTCCDVDGSCCSQNSSFQTGSGTLPVRDI
jgi:hypothetical protein